jgi:outer membrane protein assembly factor BamE (lipoprotein component of BamABCDE complex)
MNKVVAAALAAVLLAGCATTAEHKVDPNTIASFQPGVTTTAQVQTALGQPFLVSHTADGGQQWQYVNKYQELIGDGTPTTGSKIPKYAEKTVSTVLVFDQSGHFVSSSSSAKSKDNNKWPSSLGNLGGGDVQRQGQ